MLNKRLADLKAEAGRNTYGLAFSNSVVYTATILFDFALSKIYTTTLKDYDIAKLGDIIRPQDLPLMLVGLVGAQYPTGFQYHRACIDNPEKCNYVAKAVLDVSKLLWVDNSGLTDWQKTHMANTTPNVKTLESVKQYQEEMLRIQDQVIDIESTVGYKLKITLTTPTMTEWMNAGDKWISEIGDIVEQSLTLDNDDEEKRTKAGKDRKRYVQTLAQASYMRQYSHWVKSIQIGSNEITDTDTIAQQLVTLSSDDMIRESFLSQTVKYISSTAICIFGIPTFSCPNCGAEQSKDLELTHPSIIPLDVIQLFFDLLFDKLQSIRNR
jgi:hypothetical protein